MVNIDPKLEHIGRVHCRRNRGNAEETRRGRFKHPPRLILEPQCSVQTAGELDRFGNGVLPPLLLPRREVLLEPLLLGAFPTDVLTGSLAFDPLVLFNFLGRGSVKLGQRILVSTV